ncbi:hypothetical protein LG296_14815 [Ureibacillus chungkukjangi]|uniref:hypothetical protein n=1 Tax=Ureibacillus chungkukjangi TaxID=1202712 RepID=UPI00384EF1BA
MNNTGTMDRRSIPVLVQLRTDLTEALYLNLLQEMQKDVYKLFALYSNRKFNNEEGG